MYYIKQHHNFKNRNSLSWASNFFKNRQFKLHNMQLKKLFYLKQQKIKNRLQSINIVKENMFYNK